MYTNIHLNSKNLHKIYCYVRVESFEFTKFTRCHFKREDRNREPMELVEGSPLVTMVKEPLGRLL